MPKIVFVMPGNVRKEVDARVGQTLLDLAHEHDVEIEGACGGALACSTCHVVLPEDCFSQLGEPCADEEDMLDLVHGLEKTSRLGCQVVVSEEMDGIEVVVPEVRQSFIS